MISDHPPFAKRDTVAEAFPNSLKPETDNENGFMEFARTVSLGLARPFQRCIEATLGASLSQSSLKGLRGCHCAKSFVLKPTHGRADNSQS